MGATVTTVGFSIVAANISVIQLIIGNLYSDGVLREVQSDSDSF